MEIILSSDDLKKLSNVIKDLPIRSLKIGWGKRITIEVDVIVSYDGGYQRVFPKYSLHYKCIKKNKIVFRYINISYGLLPHDKEELARQTIISLPPKGITVNEYEISINWKTPEILSLLAKKLAITKIRIPSDSDIIETASSYCYELDQEKFDIIEYQ